MYAVVASGGKQYKVEEGEILRIEKIPGDVGSSVTFEQILMISDGDQINIGQPLLGDAAVKGQIVEQGKAKKILVFKYKRRKRYRRKHGHRQQYTAVRIDSIEAQAGKAPQKTEAKKPAVKKVEAQEPEAGVEPKKAKTPKAAVKKKETQKPAAKVEPKKKEARKAAKPKAKKTEARPKAKKTAPQKAGSPKSAAKKTTAKSKAKDKTK
jgi:large subunit ribosomal protein L21